jgi:predicted secreted protein
MLKFLGSKYYPERTGLVGSGGVERWVFRALKRGQTRIFFKYVRPWEKGVTPVDTREYLISIR